MKELNFVYDCEVKKCPIGSNRDFGCSDMCDRCKLCTNDGMIVIKVKANNVIYEVVHATSDEIILFSKDDGLYSLAPDLGKFSEYFEIAATAYDYRRGCDYD